MRVNGDCCSGKDNGCICVVFIMGIVQVCVSRVALIYSNPSLHK